MLTIKNYSDFERIKKQAKIDGSWDGEKGLSSMLDYLGNYGGKHEAGYNEDSYNVVVSHP